MSEHTDTPEASVSELKTGVWKVRVWLITGYNYDKHDLACGGSSILGPYKWVVEGHQDAFVAEMRKRRGQDYRVQKIIVEGRAFCEADKVPTLEEELRSFEEYLADPKSWNC